MDAILCLEARCAKDRNRGWMTEIAITSRRERDRDYKQESESDRDYEQERERDPHYKQERERSGVDDSGSEI